MSTGLVEEAAHADPRRGGVELLAAFEALRAGFRAEPSPRYEVRKARLEQLLHLVRSRRDDITAAISADFGHRSRHESWMADVGVVANNLRFVIKQLKRWMAPEARPTSLAFQPARARVVAQPKGVIGVISPWNYPFQLALVPLTYALAAGNRVLLKPSERSPRSSALLAELLGSVFDPDLVSVVVGDGELGARFAALPLDHILFTGSERVGKLVLAAAAPNLTPVTLELGGKSPAVVHPDAPTEITAARIVAGKWFNSGQTCIAPDYVLVRRDHADALVAAMRTAAVDMGASQPDNGDVTAIIDEAHRAHLDRLVADAEAKGATVERLREGGVDAVGRYPLTLVRQVTDDMAMMQEEIFGPVLPIVEVETYDEAVDYLNDRPRPLAMYLFDRNQDRIESVLERTHAGGVTVNDCLLHCAEENLPFGGVGASGMGAYHGKEGFDTFSHRKAVLHQARWSTRFLTSPPYGRALERLLELVG